MQTEHLSKRDAISLLELIHKSTSCADEKDFRDIFESLKGLFAHDYAICTLAGIGSNGAIQSYDAINLSYPSEWIARYIAQQEHRVDPIIKANFTRYRLQYFGDILREFCYPKKNAAVANDFGIVDGYVHGLRNDRGTAATMFCFAGRWIERDARTETLLELAVPHFHQALIRVLNKNVKKDIVLSPREKEVLTWIKQGKSTWDISVLLKISERTVKFHVSNIMQKLGASTRAHAAAIAIEQGLVGIE